MIPLFVVVFSTIVRLPIYFYNGMSFGAIKIYDIIPDDLLSVEIQPVKFSGFYCVPK